MNDGRGQGLSRRHGGRLGLGVGAAGTRAAVRPFPGLPDSGLVVRVLSVMVGLSMYVFSLASAWPFEGYVSTHHGI